MRILFLTPQFPYPPHKGTTMRNYYLIANLAVRYEIDLLTFIESDAVRVIPALAVGATHASPLPTSPLQELCRRIEGITVPKRSLPRRAADTLLSPWPDMGLRLWSPTFAARLDAWLTETHYDVVQIEGIELARYMLAADRRHALRDSRFVFDDHNCEYLLQRRAFETDVRIPSRWLGAAYSFVQWRKLCAFERQVCRAADHVVAVSDADAAALQQLAPGLQVTVVPNGIDVASYPIHRSPPPFHGKEGAADLVFTGTMDFRPNVDAALWFAQQVLPLVQQQEPRARFVVVGHKPHHRLDVLRGRSDLILTGAVDDTRPYVANAALYVVPLRMGGGTRFKILEAAAMGQAMVSTSLGCDGFPVKSGRELVIADSPRQFADAVVALLRDPARRAELSANARALAEAYDWKNILPRMEQVYAERHDV